MTNERLKAFAEAQGHDIVYLHMENNRAITYERAGCHIAIANHLSLAEEKEVLAHELGHCEYGGTYNRYSPFEIKAKAEYRADKWAYSKLVPIRSLRNLMKHGLVDVWDLAEYFDVTDRFMYSALMFYSRIGVL